MSTTSLAVLLQKLYSIESSLRKGGKRRRAKAAAKVVPDEFRTLWRAMSVEETITETHAPYPKVDWSSVNSRLIKNIPMPSSFPIHLQTRKFQSIWLHLWIPS